MEELRNNLHLLCSIKNFVKAKNNTYYNYTIINEKNITSDTITIVMTAHERSRQVYFTLETICRSTFKDVQVIIVDDSSTDIIRKEELEKFNIHIELISIKREYKYWANPCVTYNIGFEYIRGGKVIVQNGEVCYVGDVLDYINRNVKDNNYYVFDVINSGGFHTNELIYQQKNLTTNIYHENIWDTCTKWYQHTIFRNTLFHFLCVMTRDTFMKVNGFSYDYSFGSCYDDNDLVLKIKLNNINCINVQNEETGVGGIHLYHGYVINMTNKDAYLKPQNADLFEKKKRYTEKTNTYLELSDCTDYSQLISSYNILNSY